ncbi:MAG: hypothetical protein ABIG64_00025 [Candidatus Omnitrophota bacterium]
MEKRILIAVFAFLIISVSAYAQSQNSQIIGRWIRPDGGYVLEIRQVRDDGSLEAYYYNPLLINVSIARMVTNEKGINLFVELQDKGYPGSYYMLTYLPAKEQLTGIYHQKEANKEFEIYFERQNK